MTATRAQVRELRADAFAEGDSLTVERCDLALGAFRQDGWMVDHDRAEPAALRALDAVTLYLEEAYTIAYGRGR